MSLYCVLDVASYEPVNIGEELMTTETLATLKEKYVQLEKTYKAERAALEKQIAEAQRTHQADAIAKIKLLMEEHGLTADQLSGAKKIAKTKSTKTVPPKYRGPEGQTWSGRGRQPKWVGENKDRYIIKS
jgi:DNA-binding protein H-NS